MPWFKIDDSAHMHPKWVKAGNAALGLWMRCGSYSAQHLTEGIIPAEIARLYGTAPQAAKLVKVGLWHQAGHDCPRCPQPGNSDYAMHDFFEGGRNTTRAQAQAAREAAAERQRKRRSKQNTELFDDESSAKTNRNEDESKTNRSRNEPHFEDPAAGQDGSSQRDATDGVTPPQANYQAGTPYGSTEGGKLERAGARDPEPIPDWALPLAHQIHTAGLPGLRWNLNAADWLMIHALIKTKGLDAMADHATRAAHSSTKPVVSARYFIKGWKELTNKPPDGTEKPELRPVTNGTGPRTRREQERVEEEEMFRRQMERANKRSTG